MSSNSPDTTQNQTTFSDEPIAKPMTNDQPQRMTGNEPEEITPTQLPPDYDPQETRQIREISLPDENEVPNEDDPKIASYDETPDEDYIPEINGNEKYRKNYQDEEQPEVTE